MMKETLPLRNYLGHLIDLATCHPIDVIHRFRSSSYCGDNSFQRCTSNFRSPFRPKASRHSRCRSNSNNRNKVSTIQTETSNDPINIEVHKCDPTEIAQKFVPYQFKTLQIILRHYLKYILVKSKNFLQLENPNFIKLMLVRTYHPDLTELVPQSTLFLTRLKRFTQIIT